MQQKLAAELLSKEEILGKMQVQIRELTKNIKLKYAFSLLIVPNNGILFNKFQPNVKIYSSEQKVIQYEQFIRDMQTQNRTAADNQADRNGYEELQQEVRPPVFFWLRNFYRIINKILQNNKKSYKIYIGTFNRDALGPSKVVIIFIDNEFEDSSS